MPTQNRTIADKKSDHISRVIQANADLLEAIARLQALQNEAAANVSGYTLGGPNALVDTDFVGTNGYISATQYNAYMAAIGGLHNNMNAVPSGGQSLYSILFALKP